MRSVPLRQGVATLPVAAVASGHFRQLAHGDSSYLATCEPYFRPRFSDDSEDSDHVSLNQLGLHGSVNAGVGSEVQAMRRDAVQGLISRCGDPSRTHVAMKTA